MGGRNDKVFRAREFQLNSSISGVTQNLIKGTETALTGGYGRRMTEAYDNGEFGAAGGNLLAGMAYGAMNLATLGEAGAVASASRGLFARLGLGEANAAAQSVWALHPFERGVVIEKALGQKALEGAQATAVRVRVLPDGRIRYYEAERAATKPGPSRGSSYVTEWNPSTGSVRSWNEVYDQAGSVNRVHPKMINGQTVNSQHYPPTARELGGQ